MVRVVAILDMTETNAVNIVLINAMGIVRMKTIPVVDMGYVVIPMAVVVLLDMLGMNVRRSVPIIVIVLVLVKLVFAVVMEFVVGMTIATVNQDGWVQIVKHKIWRVCLLAMENVPMT